MSQQQQQQQRPREQQLQLASKVPGVVAGINAAEELRLRRSLQQLERQQASKEVSDAGWLRAFAIRQTLRSQQLHRLGYSRSLEMLPDSLLADYGDSLAAVATQPLLSKITTLAMQQRRARHGIRRSVSLDTDRGLRLPPITGDGQSQASGATIGGEAADTTRLSLPSIRAGEPPPGADQSLRSAAAPLAKPLPGSDQSLRSAAAPLAKPLPGSDQSLRAYAEPQAGADQSERPQARGQQRPLADPRFLQLVGSLERKSAWKRKYVPPVVANSLDALVSSYYYYK